MLQRQKEFTRKKILILVSAVSALIIVSILLIGTIQNKDTDVTTNESKLNTSSQENTNSTKKIADEFSLQAKKLRQIVESSMKLLLLVPEFVTIFKKTSSFDPETKPLSEALRKFLLNPSNCDELVSVLMKIYNKEKTIKFFNVKRLHFSIFDFILDQLDFELDGDLPEEYNEKVFSKRKLYPIFYHKESIDAIVNCMKRKVDNVYSRFGTVSFNLDSSFYNSKIPEIFQRTVESKVKCGKGDNKCDSDCCTTFTINYSALPNVLILRPELYWKNPDSNELNVKEEISVEDKKYKLMGLVYNENTKENLKIHTIYKDENQNWINYHGNGSVSTQISNSENFKKVLTVIYCRYEDNAILNEV